MFDDAETPQAPFFITEEGENTEFDRPDISPQLGSNYPSNALGLTTPWIPSQCLFEDVIAQETDENIVLPEVCETTKNVINRSDAEQILWRNITSGYEPMGGTSFGQLLVVLTKETELPRPLIEIVRMFDAKTRSSMVYAKIKKEMTLEAMIIMFKGNENVHVFPADKWIASQKFQSNVFGVSVKSVKKRNENENKRVRK